MAEVGGARRTLSSHSISAGQQLWRPAKEVLQFLTECAPPPPLLALDIDCSSSNGSFSAKPDAGAAPANRKRQPPSRWEPPSQMKVMRAAQFSSSLCEGVPDQQVAGTSPTCRQGLSESNGSIRVESACVNESVPNPSVNSNSISGGSANSVHIHTSSDCSERSPGQSSINIWQFPRPSKTTSSKSTGLGQSPLNLLPQNGPEGQNKVANEERNSGKGALSRAEMALFPRTIPKIANAFATAAGSQSSSWGLQTSILQSAGSQNGERVPSSVNHKASGFDNCAAKKNSFEAFASVARDKIFSTEMAPVSHAEKQAMESLKADNLGEPMPAVREPDASNSSAEHQENVDNSKIGDLIANQLQTTNSQTEEGQPAAIDLLVNAVQVASGTPSVAVDKRVDCDKVVANNPQNNGSSKVSKISYFLHGRVPFKRKKVTRRAKSAYPKCAHTFKDAASSVAACSTYDAINPCQQKSANENSDSRGRKNSDNLGDPKVLPHQGKHEKQIPQMHKSLHAIMSGNEGPRAQFASGRTNISAPRYHDTMISISTKKSRTKNSRRSSDTWRLNE